MYSKVNGVRTTIYCEIGSVATLTPIFYVITKSTQIRQLTS